MRDGKTKVIELLKSGRTEETKKIVVPMAYPDRKLRIQNNVYRQLLLKK